MIPIDKANKLVNDMLTILYAEGSFSFKHVLYTKAKDCAVQVVFELMKECPAVKQEYYKEVLYEIHRLRYEEL